MPYTIPRFLPSTFFIVILLSCLGAPMARSEELHPGQDIEVRYSEAVITFVRKDYNQTVELLNSLLKGVPGNPEALELKALALKTAGKDKESLATYRELLRIKPEAERAPYS